MNETLMKLGLGVVLAGGIYVCAKAGEKINSIEEKLNCSIADLKTKTSVDIQDSMIERVVTDTVEREVSYKVNSIAANVASSVEKDIHNQVKQAVKEQYNDIRGSVSQEVTNQVAKLDIAQLKKEVERQAKEDVLEKFDANLDDILDDFNDNLSKVKKIYSGIADTISNNKTDNDLVFRVGR